MGVFGPAAVLFGVASPAGIGADVVGGSDVAVVCGGLVDGVTEFTDRFGHTIPPDGEISGRELTWIVDPVLPNGVLCGSWQLGVL